MTLFKVYNAFGKSQIISDPHKNIYIAALFFNSEKHWKQPQSPSVDQWTNKMWHVHAMDYCLTVKGNQL